MLEHIRAEFNNCYYREKSPEKAYQLIKNSIPLISFSNEEDLRDLNSMVLTALNYEDGASGLELLKLLIENGYNINYKFSDRLYGKAYFIFDLLRFDISPEIFQAVVDLGADPYVGAADGDNVLLYAADSKLSDKLAAYIATNFYSPDLDHPDSRGTPLMYAAIHNKPLLADALIKHGTDVNAAPQCRWYGLWLYMDGVTALALALCQGNYEISKKLLDAGADETICDRWKKPAQFYLIKNAYRFKETDDKTKNEILERKGEIVALLKYPELVDSHGNTLLMKCISSSDYNNGLFPEDNFPVFNALVERGANVNAANNAGKRPLHLAVEYCRKYIKPLLALGADIDAQDGDGNTALMLLCMNRDEKTARMFIRKGADYTLRNRESKSAVDIAVEKGLLDVLELIV